MTNAAAGSDGARQPSGDGPEATLISVVLDRSGSMGLVREATIAGFNDFVATQRKQNDGGRALMSLTQFDDRYEVNFVGEPIDNVPALDAESYVPRGMTALFDAIARTVHELDAWIAAHDWRERILVLIITDGRENSSTEHTFDAVRALIEQKEKAGWNFAYMGANQDSFAVAGSLSIRRDFTLNYDATAAGTTATFQRMAHATSSYRSSKAKGTAATGFFDGSARQPDADDTAGKLLPRDANGGKRASTGRAAPTTATSRLKSWSGRKPKDEVGH